MIHPIFVGLALVVGVLLLTGARVATMSDRVLTAALVFVVGGMAGFLIYFGVFVAVACDLPVIVQPAARSTNR